MSVGPVYTDEQVERIKELRASGLSYKEITYQMGLTCPAIAWRLANREEYNRIVRESVARYRKRGEQPLWNGDNE
jgi:hypothetical protein